MPTLSANSAAAGRDAIRQTPSAASGQPGQGAKSEARFRAASALESLNSEPRQPRHAGGRPCLAVVQASRYEGGPTLFELETGVALKFPKATNGAFTCAMTPKASAAIKNHTASLGFEAKLWLAADKLRNNMDAAEYKHVVLGLIFLKYISDTFEEHRAKLVAGKGDYAGANPEDQDEYRAENVFWVPKEARWAHLQASAKQPTIGKIVDDAMVAIERDNPRLKGVAAQGLRPPRPRQAPARRTDRPHRHHRPGRARRTAPRTSWAASTNTSSPSSPAPRARTAASSTPRPASSACLVEMLAPYKGRVYDPCCGSGGMFVQSREIRRSPRRRARRHQPSTARRATPPPAAWR